MSRWNPLDPALIICAFREGQSETGAETVRSKVLPPNVMADAEAIAEAARRPSSSRSAPADRTIRRSVQRRRTRFVGIKSPGQLGLGMIIRLRGHLPEFGNVAGKGRETAAELRPAPETGDAPKSMSQLCLGQIDGLSTRNSELDGQIQAATKRAPLSARLRMMPRVGPATAMAVAACDPPMEAFGRGRDFPAWPAMRSVSRTDRIPARPAGTAFGRRQAAAGRNQKIRTERCQWPLGPAARPSALRRVKITGAMRDGSDFGEQGADAGGN
ncbi:hypothetical protein [Mangrovicoccus ximenensis]|uniref:hypothetical protein n=1 Tax=Mangrovicoccus ximenensis TaxID=1911570 RepID=UPI0011AE7F3E|nr:hypothetical protein [Mangrovicoccus ximenensis]